jgi:threonine dehydrogenase-like Zn-dependent dehydrogenase
MKALCWHGTNDIRCDSVPDPKIEEGRDVVIKVTSCAICGSDLHLMDGLMPTMKSGDILGHEFMGEVIETGSAHTKFRKGDRIVVPFNINCGECRQCKLGNYSVCQRSNRNAAIAAAQFGYTTAGLFGYSHLTGGYAGGQAEYVRVPMADVAPMKVPEGMTDEEVLFLTDIFPTGYQAAEQAGIKGGEIVAIWGTGPVGLFAIQSAKVLGAGRIIAIETVPERIAMARKAGATDIINFAEEDVFERIKEISKGEGADVVIDCVGMEASPGHGQGGLVRESHAGRAHLCSRPGHQGGAAVRRGLDPRRLRGPCFRQHGLDRAERPQAVQRPDPCETLSRASDQAHSSEEGRHDLPHHPPQHGSR